MAHIQIDLYKDWIDTVKEVFRGSGSPLPEGMSDADAALSYFLQTASTEEEASRQRADNEQRMAEMQAVILDNFESVIWPDISKRTGYTGEAFIFRWVYNQGEHIIEEYSSYRIPL